MLYCHWTILDHKISWVPTNNWALDRVYIGIRDICHFISRDMGYVSSELLGYGILHCHFGYFYFLIDNIFVQCGGRVLQHLICIKIGTVRPTHRLVSSLLQGRLNRSCQMKERHLARSKISWVPTNNWALDRVYWDTGYLPFFFRDMGYVTSELLGYGILQCHFGYF
jgi:hypothetical protein